MRFDFEHEVDLEPDNMRTVMFGHEPDEPGGTLVQYFIDGDLAESRSAMIRQGQYGDLADMLEDDIPPRRMTDKQILRIGVKSLVGLGAYGFYVSRDETGVYTRVMIPINWSAGGPPPTLIIGQTDTTLTYTIGNPDIISYECFRLTLRRGHFAHEFITYDLEGEVEKPFDMEGEYSVTVIGYKNEISEFSKPTEPMEFTVEKRSDAPPDVPNIDMEAIKEEIAQQMAKIDKRLLPPGGDKDDFLGKVSGDDYDVGWSPVGGGTGGGIEEAPVDDGLYGRRNAAWEAVPGFEPPPPVVVITATASQFWSSAQYPTFHAPWNAVEGLFDSVSGGGGWLTNPNTSTGWIRLGYSRAWRATSVTLRAPPDEPNWMPRNFHVIGIGNANANSPRVTLATFTSLPAWSHGQERTYTFPNDSDYEAYELNIHISAAVRIYINRIRFD